MTFQLFYHHIHIYTTARQYYTDLILAKLTYLEILGQSDFTTLEFRNSSVSKTFCLLVKPEMILNSDKEHFQYLIG